MASASCLGFFRSSSTPLQEEGAYRRVDLSERKARDARITAFALTIVAIVLMAITFTLFGVATLTPEVTMGLGILPYLAGTFFGAVGIAVFIGALTHLAISSVRDCQKREWQQELAHSF